MSFCDVFLSQLSTFSYEDVEKVYYKVKQEHEQRVKDKIAQQQMSGLQKLESLFSNLYKTCKSVKVTQCDKYNLEIHFTPNDQYIVTGNFSGRREPLEPPYSIRIREWKNNFEITVDLNHADSCTSYPDLWYSYKKDSDGTETYPYECNKGRCNKIVPSQLMDLELVSGILKNPKRVWYFLTPNEQPK